MKEHTIWFWLYWALWGVISFLNIFLNAAGKDSARLFGNIIGMIVLGYIGYRIGKWVYDY